jgi:hypothetical protein
MIHITNHTTQQEIIDLLLSKLPEQGNLYVEILDLPYFLASIPSIKVFQYKIQKYPRPIYWFSHNPEIFELLQLSSLLVDFPPSLTYLVEKKPATIINLNSNLADQKNKVNVAEAEFSYNQKTNNEPKLNYSLLPKNFDQNTSFNLSQFTKPIDFTSSSILDEFRKKHLYKDPKASIKQDLDQWLEKIESTKNALSKFQTEAEENKIQATEKQNFASKFWSYFANPFVYRSLVSCTLIAMAFGFWYFYPTNKYKLDIVPTIHQDAIDARLPDSIFKKTQIELKTSASIEPSGQKTSTGTTRAIGKVALINNSTSAVEFNKDGIILISETNGLEYSHKSSSVDPKVFSVPAKNLASDQKVEIEIQAVDSGDKFDLPINSTFRVYNLKGEAMGSSFKAVASNDIKSTNSSGDKIFTEDDMSLLRTKLEQGFLDEKNKQIQDLKDSSLLTNSAWAKLSQPTYDFSATVGSTVKTVSAQAQASVEILSLPKKTLTAKIQEQLVNKQISDITIVDTQIADSTVSTKLFVSYAENPDFFKNEIQNKVKSVDFDRATADLQSTYPNVKRVSKNFSGINLPMVAPRNKIEINQVGEK